MYGEKFKFSHNWHVFTMISPKWPGTCKKSQPQNLSRYIRVPLNGGQSIVTQSVVVK